MRLTFRAVRVDTGTPDEVGRLVFLGERLVAVLVCLTEPPAEAGHWFLEHGFGRLDVPSPPIFPDLHRAEAWIVDHLNRP